MIGSRVGSRLASLLGARVGSSADDEGSTGLVGVAQDATSLKYVPATVGQLNSVISAAGLVGTPIALWLMQEAAGNPADSSGNGFTLTATGTPSYQQAVAGWSRFAITYADASAGGLSTVAAGLPDVNTGSLVVIAYIKMPNANPAGTRNFIQIGTDGANRGDIAGLNTGVARGFISGTTLNGSSNPFTGAVRPVVISLDQTANTFEVYTDQDRIAPAFNAAITGKGIRFNGSAISSSIAGGELWAAAIQAEWAAAQVRSFLQTLNWSIPW